MSFASYAFSNFSDKNKVSELKHFQSFAVKMTIDQVHTKHFRKMCVLQGAFTVFLSSFWLLQIVVGKVTVEPETEGNFDEQTSNVLPVPLDRLENVVFLCCVDQIQCCDCIATSLLMYTLFYDKLRSRPQY